MPPDEDIGNAEQKPNYCGRSQKPVLGFYKLTNRGRLHQGEIKMRCLPAVQELAIIHSKEARRDQSKKEKRTIGVRMLCVRVKTQWQEQENSVH